MGTVGLLILLCVCAALAELVLHWFPWEMLIGDMLPRPIAYVLGVYGFAIPLTIFYAFIEQAGLILVIALWSMISSAGLAVLLAYGVDWMMDKVRTVSEQREVMDARRKTEEL